MRAFTAAIALCALGAASAQDWHNSLYLGNDGVWRQRVRVDIRNGRDREANGEPVALRVGKAEGEADLVGALADAVRVCDVKGTEMLFGLSGPDGSAMVRGPIPAGSTLTLPAECPANGAATYYVYFDNLSAWRVPDFLDVAMGVRNGGLEEGAGDCPAGWRHDVQDEQHRVFWITGNPHSGKRCLKTVVAEGAQETWIATRQSGLHIIGGAQYTMRAWVKAENVMGYAGWYIHVGNDQNYMIVSPMLSGGGGTYDWKEVTAEFTAPVDADKADLGTVLWGTGTAWFDDVSLECADKPAVSATAARPERLELHEMGADAPWYDGAAAAKPPRPEWDYRVPIRVLNLTDRPASAALISVDLSGLAARLTRRADMGAVLVLSGNQPVRAYRLKDTLLFEGEAPAHTVRAYYLYLAAAQPRTATKSAPAQAAPKENPPNPALPGSQATAAALGAGPDYAALLDSPRNLVRNRSFELGQNLPDDWPGGAEGERPAGTVMGFDQPGLFGKRCAKIDIPHGSKLAWTGWRQDVPVEPGETYLYGAWLKCKDLQDGSLQLHAHYRNAAGELCKTLQMTSAGPAISGTTDWTFISGMFTMPEDIATFQLHLTMLATGTASHDGVVLAEVVPGALGRLESRTPASVAAVVAWPVNAVVKVFEDDPPPREAPAARITVARNEREPLQLAFRSAKAIPGVMAEVDPPTNAQGARLTDLQVEVVGYVPIDHTTSYYSSTSPAWHRKYPTSPGACDGWPGMWPDPLLPRNTFDLAANTTQPIWVTVAVPKDAAPGDYRGTVRLTAAGKPVKEVPFTVHVWGFTLPDETHTAAIYDTRIDSRWEIPGQTHEETEHEFWRFMAEHRVCPDGIRPDPVLKYENGKVVADFTEFDKAAEYYFDVLKLPHTYTPWYLYCFGWGFPPGEKFGQAPYEGKYPYEGADRGQLRPEFKAAYEACLKAYADHMKAKGWGDKWVLYMSDEPFDWDPKIGPDIRKQMIALCDMVHEVDPSILIYVSTWHHQPEWDGHLNLWGIGHYGVVPPEKIAEIRRGGARIRYTTDGQMCTDTPYCGVERLLPHYCFKYDVEAYEFWGCNWLTYDPYEFGWHSYIFQSDQPGKSYYVRYPNGDGFLVYPGGPIGVKGPVSSVRLEQAREGVEDYEYLYLLRNLIAKAKAAGRNTTEAEKAMQLASDLVTIPNDGGRYSTKVLPDPDAVFRAKEAVAKAIEGLNR